MKIRKLTKNDIKAIIDLEKHSTPDKPLYARYDTEALDFIFSNPEKCSAFGVFNEGELIGWGAYRTEWSEYNSKQKGIFEISSIVVDKNHRRRGIGKQLLEYVFSEIKDQKNYKKIYLTVSPKNVGALLLYLKNEFEIFDFKKDVYGPGSDRLYLQKK